MGDATLTGFPKGATLGVKQAGFSVTPCVVKILAQMNDETRG